MKKHILLIGIILSISLLAIAAAYYPGGSQADAQTVGYDWKNNYLCNLFNEKAMNGMDNHTGQLWAMVGMLCLCVSLSLFFIRFSDKITAATPAKMIKYCGVGSMVFGLLVMTPYHDLMTTLSSISALVALFYMTILILKSKLHLFKLLSILCLVVLYLNNYIYYTHDLLAYLPILQKGSFLIVFLLILGLDYFTVKEDFNSPLS